MKMMIEPGDIGSWIGIESLWVGKCLVMAITSGGGFIIAETDTVDQGKQLAQLLGSIHDKPVSYHESIQKK
ncbi:hypothetical protein J2D73_19130 [Acetobacter sacchari]|uniref:Uncharacterized protein n=1 Tax=Acetobacter sacchari TaxID=2661687 RepID=A0ABS3M150_9PROT|nr:hypothetical protein [Acetobacter sacchari]MBO1361899.1 hypothetical protein [Acetobacter sacchari]